MVHGDDVFVMMVEKDAPDLLEVDDAPEDEEVDDVLCAVGDKKKKKKRTAKKKAKSPGLVPCKPQHIRNLTGFTDYYVSLGQTELLAKPVSDLFPSGTFPVGEILPHGKTKYPNPSSSYSRTSAEERREKERLNSTLYEDVRHASEVHRQVRHYAQSIIKPGIKLVDMCEQIEECNRRLVKENGLNAGIAFPTGCSINHVAAHYSPNVGDNTVLQYGDVMKVDFGTQIGGRIIDCAFTVAFDPQFDPLLIAAKEATETGLRVAGIDVQMTEIGEAIQEVMESYEVTINGTVYPVKCCRNLCGHNIAPYKIHAGKSVPIVANGDTTRMEEGEFYAIETFGSTGRGYVLEDGECSHYMRDFSDRHVPLKSPGAKKLLGHINKTFGTLAFCRRWLERDDGGSYAVNGFGAKQTGYMSHLKALVDSGLVTALPPLVDVPGSYTAQYEHTFVLRPTCKEILSRGDDY
eukprot:gene11685-13572_t